MRDDPKLQTLPIAVGGRADQRGVIATCNYEARRYGIRSAMATAQALQRCPDLIVLPPAMDKYRVASKQILAIYREYTELVEPLSLDEAYLDVSDVSHCRGSASLMAQEIRARIAETVGITASAGIAPNKFLAKIASDWNKPDGQYVIRPDQVETFVATLPVDKLYGVGKVTAAKLNKLGANTCADLCTWPMLKLQHHFGKFGERLYELSRGIDTRAVVSSRERKSISVEETYVSDLQDLTSCLTQLPELIERLHARIARADAARQIRKLFIKIRFADFQRTTVECLANTIDRGVLENLLETGLGRRRQAVRLLGVGVRLQEEDDNFQIGLFHAESDDLSIESTD